MSLFTFKFIIQPEFKMVLLQAALWILQFVLAVVVTVTSLHDNVTFCHSGIVCNSLLPNPFWVLFSVKIKNKNNFSVLINTCKCKDTYCLK